MISKKWKPSTAHGKKLLLAMMVAGGLATGCASPQTGQNKASAHAVSDKQQINAATKEVLDRLYEQTPEAKQIVSKAKGVLVFPKVLAAGLMVGGEYGRGVLKVKGQPHSYYSTMTASVGFQAGAQSKAQVILFMTDEALKNFQESKGWTVGVDASVALMKKGTNGHMDLRQMTKPVLGFVMTNGGHLYTSDAADDSTEV